MRTAERIAATIVGLVLWLGWVPTAAALDEQEDAPEAATTVAAPRPPARSSRYMIAAANPLAAEAGREMLRLGGSAVDAAIAAQLVLGLVEPQSSGLGGGAFLVYWDQTAQKVTTFDGRETAPDDAAEERFLDDKGQPRPFRRVVESGLSVGVPGVVRLMGTVHAHYGRLPWPMLFDPAIKLAEQGFAVTSRLNALLARETALKKDPAAAAYFYQANGQPVPVGAVLRNPAYATVLKTLSAFGDTPFYEGKIADDIIARVAANPSIPGDINKDDMADYRVKERPPVCGVYRLYRLCGMGPPSSGAVAINQILSILEPVVLRQMPPESLASVHWFAEAARLAFADRAKYLADPDFVYVPVDALLTPKYIQSRAALISEGVSIGTAPPGEPPSKRGGILAPQMVEHEFGTSHLSIVDSFGNAVAMTTSIEDAFGARMMVDGFLLNNQLTDFSFLPSDGHFPIANRVEGGKRPRSSMAPMIVFSPNGKLFAVVGSAGGAQIINYVAKTLVALIDWNLNPQDAVALPNIGSRNGPTELEAGTAAAALAPQLEVRGHAVKVMPMTSGTQAITVRTDGLWGGADPRREGVAVGD